MWLTSPRHQDAGRCSSPRRRPSICSRTSIIGRATRSLKASHKEEQAGPKPGTSLSGNRDLWCCTTQRKIEGTPKKKHRVVAEICLRQGRNALNKIITKTLRKAHGICLNIPKIQRAAHQQCMYPKQYRTASIYQGFPTTFGLTSGPPVSLLHSLSCNGRVQLKLSTCCFSPFWYAGSFPFDKKKTNRTGSSGKVRANKFTCFQISARFHYCLRFQNRG